ncbi:MAG: hypothetical protein AAFU85_24015 [Planctomycetota bacterium]
MSDGFDTTWEHTRILLRQFEELLMRDGGESEDSRRFFETHKGKRDFESYARQLIYEHTDPDARSPTRRRRG